MLGLSEPVPDRYVFLTNGRSRTLEPRVIGIRRVDIACSPSAHTAETCLSRMDILFFTINSKSIRLGGFGQFVMCSFATLELLDSLASVRQFLLTNSSGFCELKLSLVN